MTIGDLLFQTAQRNPEKEALVYGKTRLGYRDLLERVDQLAIGLWKLGLRKGDRLGLHLYNCHQAYEALLAAARSGLIFVPLNHMLNGKELSTIINNAGIRAIIVEPELYPILAPVLPDLSTIEVIISLGHIEGTSITYETLIQETPVGRLNVSVEEENIFGLMYTSGTTGLPKGVILTHRNIVTHARNMIRDYEIEYSSRGAIVLPYFVGASLNGIGLPCILQGATVIILRRFSPEIFLKTVEEEQVTHTQIVPTLIIRLLESNSLGGYDSSSLELFGYGSAPMPVNRLKQAIQRFGPIFSQMYGLTETSAMAICLRKNEHVLRGPKSTYLKSIGRPVQGVDVQIINDAGIELPTGNIGEIIIRGPTVMPGYWETPELTDKAIQGGWFHTGDLAYKDKEGYIYLTDRKKDIIVSGGFNIYPKEIEDVLYTHSDVLECAVIGVLDPHWGESIKAFVTLQKNVYVTKQELLDFCRKHLSSFKRPKFIEFVSEIPRNPSGKVIKRLLRKNISNQV